MKGLLRSLLFALVLHAPQLMAQNVGINATGAAPAASAMLDIVSTTSGLLIPRVSLTATNLAGPITLPATSLLVYNLATAGVAPNNVTPGYYYWTGVVWTRLFSGGDGWLTIGNGGTVAGTNFIGTTDARDFVTKTGGSAATNERLRVLSAGNIVQNNTGIIAGDVFSVYANNTIAAATNSITNTLGTFAVNGYASVDGTGVYGEVEGGASTQGTAVWGQLFGANTPALGFSDAVYGDNFASPLGTGATAGVATGVRGEAYGLAGTAFTMGVIGVNAATLGAAFGVYGITSSSGAAGVFGTNTNTASINAHGVQGQSASTAGAAGVRGFNTAAAVGAGQTGYGVRGTVAVAPTGTGFVVGVRGDATGVTGAGYGLLGTSASPLGFGLGIVQTSATGTGTLITGNNLPNGLYIIGGSGSASNGTVIGTYSIGRNVANGVGLMGIGNAVANLAPAVGCGVSGAGAQYGIVGYATTTVNTLETSNATANGAAASAGGYFEVQNAGVPQTWAYVAVRDNTAVLRKIIGPGTVNTIVNDLDGNRVALSCPEAPENLFQDYGAGDLVNGRAHVVIDPIFTKNIVVNAQHPLRVFVQLEGDCAGVYVTNKTAQGFDVVELNGGTSNVPFSFSITANRADETNPDGTIAHYSAERFPPAPGPQPSVQFESREQSTAVFRNSDSELPASLPVAQKPKSSKRSR